MKKINKIKSTVVTRRAIPGYGDDHPTMGVHQTEVSMFTVDGRYRHFIGFIHPDGYYSVYHSGQASYIKRLWEKRYNQ
jgi:hypothetical protein